MELIFLGSGGGRWVTITQRLKTGGIVLKVKKDIQIHIDPGPGALVCAYENKISPLSTNAIFVTHCHPDHYNDAEILIEAMTKGMTKVRGVFAGSKSVVEGIEGIGPAVSSYHLSKVEKLFILEPEKKFIINGVEVSCLKAYHTDPTNVGLRLDFDRTLIYTSDTEYRDNIAELYKDADIIVFNVIRPRGERIRGHLCVNDVINILKEVKPKIAILNHFGMKMVDERFKEAKRVEKETGVRTISATDGLSLDLKELKIRGQLRF